MEAVDAMDVQTLEKDEVNYRPVINSWARTPSREQIRYATDLCRSELPYAERVRTIRTFEVLDSHEVSALIERLRDVRAKRLARLRRARRRNRR